VRTLGMWIHIAAANQHNIGDSFSRGGEPESQELKALKNRLGGWLKIVFREDFRSGDGRLAIGSQEDTSSCGVCAISAMEHSAFSVPNFSHRTRNTIRIRYFVEMAGYILEHVGDPFENVHRMH
jgi:hypothetical protein